MTKAELENKLDELETAEFILQMKDRWDARDFEEDSRLNSQIDEIRSQLAKM